MAILLSYLSQNMLIRKRIKNCWQPIIISSDCNCDSHTIGQTHQNKFCKSEMNRKIHLNKLKALLMIELMWVFSVHFNRRCRMDVLTLWFLWIVTFYELEIYHPTHKVKRPNVTSPEVPNKQNSLPVSKYWIVRHLRHFFAADLNIIIIYFANVGSTQYTGNKEKRIN